MTPREIVEGITTAVSEEQIAEKINGTIPEFLDDGWAEDFDSEEEAHAETGRGEAESQCFKEVFDSFCEDNGIVDLPTELYCEVVDGLKDAWSIYW